MRDSWPTEGEASTRSIQIFKEANSLFMDPLWTNDHREWYRTVYLQSEHWKNLRASKLTANPKCERCPSKACDVHHIRYRRIFDVEMGDLLSLCRSCHEEEHRINGMPVRIRPNFQATPFPDKAIHGIQAKRDADMIANYKAKLRKKSVANHPMRSAALRHKISVLERQLASR